MQEEYHAKGKKLYMCFVDLEKAFDRVLRKGLQLLFINLPVGYLYLFLCFVLISMQLCSVNTMP